MSLPGAADPWVQFGMQMFLRSSLLLVVAWSVTRLLTRAPAAARHLVWTVSMAGLILLPLATLFGPQLPLSVLPSSTVAETVEERPRFDSVDRRPHPITPIGSGNPADSPAMPASTHAPAFDRRLLVGFVSLTVCLLLYLCLGLTRVWRLSRHAMPLNDDDTWGAMLADLRRRIGVRREIDLRISSRIAVPFTWGLGRPSILLPREAASWSRDRRRDCLLHELAHVRRLDWVSHMTARLACALHWYNPLTWWVSRRLHLEAERACDDTVLLEGSAAPEYADQLLAIARGVRRQAASVGFVSMAMPAQLTTRIHYILHGAQRRTTMKTIQVIGSAAAAALLVIAAGGVRLVEAAPEPARPGSTDDLRQATAILDTLAGAQQQASPLHIASSFGLEGVADMLLDEGADVDARDDRGCTPLHAASAQFRYVQEIPGLSSALTPRYSETVELLLSSGAALDARDRGQRTPLHYAAENGRTGATKRLLAGGAEIDAGDGQQMTALHLAARNGRLDVTEILLNAGASPEVIDRSGRTPLHYAAENGYPLIVTRLSQQDSEVTDGSGLAPLHLAARNGRGDVVELFLESGANYASRDAAGRIPFHYAAENGYEAIVEDLLLAGSDINAADDSGSTALHLAARYGRVDVIEFLLNENAEIDLRDRDGATALDIALRCDQSSAAQLLR